MTLEYQSVGYKPPCATGLKVWAIAFWLSAAWTWYSILDLPSAMRTYYEEVSLWQDPLMAVLLGGVVVEMVWSVVSGMIALTLGIGMWFGKRWVRPLVLIVSIWWLVATLSLMPTSLLGTVQRLHEEGRLIPQFVIAALVGMSIVPIVVIQMFRYFSSRNMMKTLNHIDPGMSWVERFPLVVFGAFVFAISDGLLGLMAVPGFAVQFKMAGGVWLATHLALQTLVSLLQVIGGLACLRWPTLGWSMLVAAVLLWAVNLVLEYRVMADSWHSSIATGAAVRLSIDQYKTTWYDCIPGALVITANLAMLWIWRSEFVSTDDPESAA